MKTSKHTNEILNKIEKSLEKDMPLLKEGEGKTVTIGNSHISDTPSTLKSNKECHTLAGISLPTGPEEMPRVRGKKTANVVKIETMSLYRRQFTTSGMHTPLPLLIETADYNVHEGDTWENLAARTAFDLEILLRVNDVPVDKVYDILDKKSTTADIPLQIGQTIKLPLKKISEWYY